MEATPFTIAIPDERLADLDRRLRQTNWARDYANDDWRYGTNGEYLRELVDYWITSYDWRCLLYTSPSPRDATLSRMPSSA